MSTFDQSQQHTGMEPMLGGDLRLPRAVFAPWPYPKALDDVLQYIQHIAWDDIHTYLAHQSTEHEHTHLIAAAIAAVRDPGSAINLQCSAAITLHRMMSLGQHEPLKQKPLELLQALADHPHYLVRAHVTGALNMHAMIQGHDPLPLPKLSAGDLDDLIDLLAHGTVLVRQQSAGALADLPDALRPLAAEPLLQAAEDESIAVQIAALNALGPVHNPSHYHLVLTRLEAGQDDRLRSAAASVIGYAEHPKLMDRAIKTLTQVLDNDNPSYLRHAAARALGRIGAGTPDDAQRAYAVAPLLETAAKGAHYALRVEAINALGETGAQSPTGEIGDSIIGQLTQSLRDPAAQVRYSAVDALTSVGLSGNHRAVELSLHVARDDRHPSVQLRAEEALARLRGHYHRYR